MSQCSFPTTITITPRFVRFHAFNLRVVSISTDISTCVSWIDKSAGISMYKSYKDKKKNKKIINSQFDSYKIKLRTIVTIMQPS